MILALLTFDAFRHAAKPPPKPALIGIAVIVSFGTLVQKGAHVIHQSLMAVREFGGSRIPNPHLTVAAGLSQAGLQRGDKVGVIGSALHSYWARLAGVRIVAEIPSYECDEYWGGSDSTRSAADSAFWRSGARVIIAGGRHVRSDLPGWTAIPAPGDFVNWAKAPVEEETAAGGPAAAVTTSRP